MIADARSRTRWAGLGRNEAQVGGVGEIVRRADAATVAHALGQSLGTRRGSRRRLSGASSAGAEIALASELVAHDFSSPREPPTLLEQLAQPPPELTRHREPSTASNHTIGAVPALRHEAELRADLEEFGAVLGARLSGTFRLEAGGSSATRCPLPRSIRGPRSRHNAADPTGFCDE